MEFQDVEVTALGRLFSASVVRELARLGRSPLFASLLRESNLGVDSSSREHVGTLFDLAFHQLQQRENRTEYVYKAAITQKILLGIHSLRTASMMTEFRVGTRKADVVVLNGSASAYEIKSERDCLSRLEQQVDEYRRVFASVNVVAAERHLRAVEKVLPDFVGISVLTDRFRLSRVRPAIDDPDRTESTSIFDSIGQREAALILSDAGFALPKLPNTQIYGRIREIFSELNPRVAHLGMVRVLKRTRGLESFHDAIESVPVSMRAAIVSSRLGARDRENLLAALKAPICDAIAWG
jgi:hypothetical protein